MLNRIFQLNFLSIGSHRSVCGCMGCVCMLCDTRATIICQYISDVNRQNLYNAFCHHLNVLSKGSVFLVCKRLKDRIEYKIKYKPSWH